MKGYKTDRHKNNPKEKEFHDKFIELFEGSWPYEMDLVVFKPKLSSYYFPENDSLTDREKRIVISTIQWLGSPVGQKFLNDVGFVNKKTESEV
jgi:hypothetical protein